MNLTATSHTGGKNDCNCGQATQDDKNKDMNEMKSI